jgi:hypothetical protein
MNNKEKALRACRQIVKRYREPDEDAYLYGSTCALCRLFFTVGCIPCPLADGESDEGCTKFNSYREIQDIIDIYFKEEAREAFSRRADVYEQHIIPILEKLPPERFTKRGWRFIEELDRSL